MPYIGKNPVGGGFHKLDALTASATATYALTLNSAAYYPESANQLLVSLNGVIQAPQDSFTVSGSNLVFDTALTTSDSIDFVVALGDVLAVQTVTDGAITTAKLGNGAVTSAKLDTNIAVSGNLDVGTIRDAAGTNTAMTIDSTGRILTPQVPYFYFRGYAGLATSAIAGTDKPVYFDAIEESRGGGVDNSSTLGASYTVPVAGVYCIWANVGLNNTADYLGLALYHGTTLKQKGWSGNDLPHYSNSVQVVMNLAQNDVIRCTIDISYGVPSTNSEYMNFCGYLIG